MKNNLKINDIVLMLPSDVETIFNNGIGKIIGAYGLFGNPDDEYKWVVSFIFNGKNNSVAFSEKNLLKLSE